MDCKENEFVCSVRKENNLGYYRLHSIWKNDGFFLNVASRDGAWRGEMTQKDVVDISRQLGMSPESYLKQCKKVLTKEQPEISYSVENNCFAWKKVDDQDSGIKIKMGFVAVEPANFIETIQNAVSAALEQNRKLQEEVQSLRIEKEKNVASKQECLKKLDESLKMKEIMENDLYRKFILLLNSKKKKINELETVIENKNKTSTNASIKPSEILDSSHENLCTMNTESDYDSDKTDFSTTEPIKIKKKKLMGKKIRKEPVRESLTCPKTLTDKAKRPSNIAFKDGGVKDSTKSNEKTEIPSSKNELLNFFYG